MCRAPPGCRRLPSEAPRVGGRHPLTSEHGKASNAQNCSPVTSNHTILLQIGRRTAASRGGIPSLSCARPLGARPSCGSCGQPSQLSYSVAVWKRRCCVARRPSPSSGLQFELKSQASPRRPGAPPLGPQKRHNGASWSMGQPRAPRGSANRKTNSLPSCHHLSGASRAPHVPRKALDLAGMRRRAPRAGAASVAAAAAAHRHCRCCRVHPTSRRRTMRR